MFLLIDYVSSVDGIQILWNMLYETVEVVCTGSSVWN